MKEVLDEVGMMLIANDIGIDECDVVLKAGQRSAQK
jgi:hypothetical protein